MTPSIFSRLSIPPILALFLALALALAPAGCDQAGDASGEASGDVPGEPVRAVKTATVAIEPVVRDRAYPAVLEPRQITPLAFEVAGRLGVVDLQIGQKVSGGETLMTVNPKDFELTLEHARTSVREARTSLENARRGVERRRSLFDRGVISEAALDEAETKRAVEAARLERAMKSQELAAQSLEDTVLKAPFDGLINSVDVESYASVKAGEAVLTMYRDDAFQARILVGLDVVETLAVGQEVAVDISAARPIRLEGRIAEIAHRAPSVSAFPVIVEIDQPGPYLRSGVPVEIIVGVPFRQGGSMALPLSALVTHLQAELEPVPGDDRLRAGKVFVFDDDTSRLSLRSVTIGGIDETRMLITDGLKRGERVVTAGVPFLRPGQQVTLWRPDGEGQRR